MKQFQYQQPNNLAELHNLLDNDPSAVLYAGGTDILPQIHRGDLAPTSLVDISRIEELDILLEKDDSIVIGALTTYSKIVDEPILQKFIPSLIQAARGLGAPTTRSRGTIGGNIANASPAGDTIPPLLTHDAILRLSSLRGDRYLHIGEFLIGPGETTLQSGEVIRSISIPKPKGFWGSTFSKIGPRRGLTISIINCAAFIQLSEKGLIHDARVALGAVAATAIRTQKTETYLTGKKPDEIEWNELSLISNSEISPIDDIRGSQTYRNHTSGILLQRVLKTALDMAHERLNR